MCFNQSVQLFLFNCISSLIIFCLPFENLEKEEVIRREQIIDSSVDEIGSDVILLRLKRFLKPYIELYLFDIIYESFLMLS
jgi:hypothetical protein